MNQNRLRVLIFVGWSSCLLLGILGSLLAPKFANEGAILDSQIPALLRNIVGVFIPALSCLAGFWFPNEERKRATNLRLTRDRTTVALIVTFGYLAIVLLLLFWPLYFVDYLGQAENMPGLEERVLEAIGVAQLLSPLSLLPIHFLTSNGSNAKVKATTTS